MEWSRVKFVLDRFESMSMMNLKELKQHIRRIQQTSRKQVTSKIVAYCFSYNLRGDLPESPLEKLEGENDLDNSVIEKNNAKRLIDQLLAGLKQILELRISLAEGYRDMFDSRIEPIRLQIQGMANTFNLVQRQQALTSSRHVIKHAPQSNIFDDCFNECDGADSNSIYEQQLLTQETLNPKLEELKMAAQQRKMDAEASEKLAQDIDDLNQVMTDLHNLVHSQHDLVDSIEEHVERSNQEVKSGHQQLKKAVASNNAKYPLMAAGVGSVVIGGPVGFAASSAIVGVVAAVGGAFAGLYGGRFIKKQANKEAGQ